MRVIAIGHHPTGASTHFPTIHFIPPFTSSSPSKLRVPGITRCKSRVGALLFLAGSSLLADVFIPQRHSLSGPPVPRVCCSLQWLCQPPRVPNLESNERTGRIIPTALVSLYCGLRRSCQRHSRIPGLTPTPEDPEARLYSRIEAVVGPSP